MTEETKAAVGASSWDAGYRQGVIRTVKLAMQIYKTDQLRCMTSKGFILNFAYHLAEMGPEWEGYAKILTDCTVDNVVSKRKTSASSRRERIFKR